MIKEKDFDEYDYIINDENLTQTEKYQYVGKLWIQNKVEKIKKWFKHDK